jgi:hypothetical protein
MAALISLVNKNIGLGFGTVTGTSCLRYESAYESLQFLGLLVLNRVEDTIDCTASVICNFYFFQLRNFNKTRRPDLSYRLQVFGNYAFSPPLASLTCR